MTDIAGGILSLLLQLQPFLATLSCAPPNTPESQMCWQSGSIMSLVTRHSSEAAMSLDSLPGALARCPLRDSSGCLVDSHEALYFSAAGSSVSDLLYLLAALFPLNV